MAGGEAPVIPLFPLNTVLFPGGALPLHIFEERYRLLVRERLDFGIVLLRRGAEAGGIRDEDLHEVGTVATLENVQSLEDGRFSVVARGLYRFRLLSLHHDRPYLTGRIKRLADPTPARPKLLTLLERYLGAHGVNVAPEFGQDVGARAVWLVGSVLQVEAARRQQLLETGDPGLAELLLSEELTKMGTIGRMGVFRPRPPSPN